MSFAYIVLDQLEFSDKLVLYLHL